MNIVVKVWSGQVVELDQVQLTEARRVLGALAMLGNVVLDG
jgi:hypothetical protein